jgi:hypothetical protein
LQVVLCFTSEEFYYQYFPETIIISIFSLLIAKQRVLPPEMPLLFHILRASGTLALDQLYFSFITLRAA